MRVIPQVWNITDDGDRIQICISSIFFGWRLSILWHHENSLSKNGGVCSNCRTFLLSNNSNFDNVCRFVYNAGFFSSGRLWGCQRFCRLHNLHCFYHGYYFQMYYVLMLQHFHLLSYIIVPCVTMDEIIVDRSGYKKIWIKFGALH